MKVPALTLLLLAGGLGFVDSSIAQSRRSGPPTARATDSPAASPGRQSSETRTLERAAAVLERRGFRDEASRLRDISTRLGQESATSGSSVDIEALSTRVEILERIAEGFAEAGDGASADAMRFFAEVGRAQLAGEADTAEVPNTLRARAGSIQDELTRLVEESAAMLREQGDRRAARLARALSQYYAERSAARERSDLADLTYIEGRVPILRLARDAYKMSSDGDEEALAWMEWMYALGRNRVSETQRDVPSTPGSYSGMGQLISYIEGAADIYEEAGRTEESVRCRALAEYYEKREKGEIVDNSADRSTQATGRGADIAVEEEPVEEMQTRAADPRPDRRRARGETEEEMVRIRELEQRIGSVQRKLEEIRKKLDGRRR